jgi:hypothetical protein
MPKLTLHDMPRVAQAQMRGPLRRALWLPPGGHGVSPDYGMKSRPVPRDCVLSPGQFQSSGQRNARDRHFLGDDQLFPE